MEVRIITIDREYGSGGNVIAEKLAARLGWKLWDQLLTDEIARRMDCHQSDIEHHEEKRDPAFYRLLKSCSRFFRRSRMRATPLLSDAARPITSAYGRMHFMFSFMPRLRTGSAGCGCVAR